MTLRIRNQPDSFYIPITKQKIEREATKIAIRFGI